MRSGYTVSGLKSDVVVKIARLSNCKNFVGEKEFMFTLIMLI